MKYKKNKPGIFAGKGFYVALALCVVAAAVASYIAVESLGGEQAEPPLVQQDVSKPDDEQPITEEPAPEPALPEQNETEQHVNNVILDIPLPEPEYVKPVTGKVINPFSGGELVESLTLGDWRAHNGTDYAAAAGEKVKSVSSGTVSAVISDPLWGLLVECALDTGYTVRYCGLGGASVKQGDTLAAGDEIGTVGDGGVAESAEPSHLHLELMKDGLYCDFETILK